VRADGTALHLGTLHALKWEQIPAHVVEHLDRVPVERVHLVADLEKRHHRVRICFSGSVFKRVDRERVVKFRDDQELPVGRHKVTVHPHNIHNSAQVWICDLLESGAGTV